MAAWLPGVDSWSQETKGQGSKAPSLTHNASTLSRKAGKLMGHQDSF